MFWVYLLFHIHQIHLFLRIMFFDHEHFCFPCFFCRQNHKKYWYHFSNDHSGNNLFMNKKINYENKDIDTRYITRHLFKCLPERFDSSERK